MLKLLFVLFVTYAQAYFTLRGKCPKDVQLQEDFRLSEFYDKWYQVYHYSSDGRAKSNCSTIELMTERTGIYLNQSRVDRELFHRYSIGKIEIPSDITKASDLNLTFVFHDAPRRIKTRRYPFKVLATNYKYYATVYTCEYSELIDKHFIYVWILSRHPRLNDVSRELAVRSLHTIDVDSEKIVKDDLNKCTPKYYENRATEPKTFNFAVPI